MDAKALRLLSLEALVNAELQVEAGAAKNHWSSFIVVSRVAKSCERAETANTSGG